MICKPSVITELTIKKPRTIRELNNMTGLTQEKISKYGDILY